MSKLYSALRAMGNIPVAIFFSTEDSEYLEDRQKYSFFRHISKFPPGVAKRC